jgi:hypothetical protein
MHGFFSHEKEVEEIGLTNQPCKRSKTCLAIPEGQPRPNIDCCASFAFATGSDYV